MKYGIEETANSKFVWLFDTKQERDIVWNERTEYGRKKLGWKKCTVELTYDKV